MLVKDHVNRRNTRTWIACNDDSRSSRNRATFVEKFGGRFIQKGRTWKWTENVLLESVAKIKQKNVYIFTRPDGIYEMVDNFTQYCEDNELSRSTMYAVLRGQRKHHKKFKVRKV
tara:strand:+ start:325 stop:669 length:345 start_codon:yes stop_codon:yes gene_type:complete